MNVLPVRHAAKERRLGETSGTSWVIALFSLPIAYSAGPLPPPASAATPFSPASSARPPEPGTVRHPWALATRLLALTQPSRVRPLREAGALDAAAAVATRTSSTSKATR
jgi:hypothetical protein